MPDQASPNMVGSPEARSARRSCATLGRGVQAFAHPPCSVSRCELSRKSVTSGRCDPAAGTDPEGLRELLAGGVC